MSGFVEFSLDTKTSFMSNVALTNDALGNTINLTGYSVACAAKTSHLNIASIAFQFSCNVVDAPNGIVTMSMTAANTANIAMGEYYFDFLIKSPANVVSKMFDGIIFVDGTITSL